MDDALAAAPAVDYIRAGQTQDNRLSGDIMGTVSPRSAVVAAGVALLLAACTGDPVPQEPDPSSTTTATPSPTPTPPAMPEEAKADTSSGAASFAIYWVRVLDHAAVTGDTAALAAISQSDCEPCQRFIELFDDTYERGGFFAESQRSLSDLSVRASEDGSVVLVHATNELSAGLEKKDASSDVVEVDAETNEITYRVERDGDRWTMAAMALNDD